MKELYQKKPERVFVMGYIGSNALSQGEELSKKLGYRLLILDRLIEERDGRTLKKIIMTMGEHEYRNKEYEIIKEMEGEKGFVMVCGDGVVHDDMSMSLLKNQYTLFAEEPVELLWERIQDDKSGLYAFLHQEDRESARKTFMEFYQFRLPLYREASGERNTQEALKSFFDLKEE